MMPYQ
jgi:serine/threonine protein kinase